MSRYFFHIVTPAGREEDLVGSEFATLEAAYLDASAAALEMSLELLRAHQDPSPRRFEVYDEAGALLIELPFSEALRMRGARPYPPGDLHERLARQVKLQRDLADGVARAHQTLAAIKSTLSEF